MAIQYTTTLAIGTRAACGNTETGPRVAIHARVSWSCAATHAARGKTQPRGANTCQLWPAPRVAIHAGNQCRVWQCTLAIRKGGRVWQSRGYQCRAWLALCADPEPQSLSPLDVSVGGRTPGRRSLGSKFPQTRQWLVRTPVQPQ